MPTVVGNNTAFLSTTIGLTNTFGFEDTGDCQGGSDGETANTAPDAVFQTTIPPNSRLTVRTTQPQDLTLNVVAGPAATCGSGMGTGIVCLDGSDTYDDEFVTASNPTGTAQTVFILVDGWLDSSGAFELTTSTSPSPPPAYAEAPFTAACDTRAMGSASPPFLKYLRCF